MNIFDLIVYLPKILYATWAIVAILVITRLILLRNLVLLSTNDTTVTGILEQLRALKDFKIFKKIPCKYIFPRLEIRRMIEEQEKCHAAAIAIMREIVQYRSFTLLLELEKKPHHASGFVNSKGGYYLLAYLIIVTKKSQKKIWDEFDLLSVEGLSREIKGLEMLWNLLPVREADWLTEIHKYAIFQHDSKLYGEFEKTELKSYKVCGEYHEKLLSIEFKERIIKLFNNKFNEIV